MRKETAFLKDEIIEAAEHVDWCKIVNGGPSCSVSPPCFHVEKGRFCFRSEFWKHHGREGFHEYKSLADLIREANL